VPFWSSPRWDSLTLWALDLETGGLDPRTDAVLSVGMVPVRQARVVVGEAFASLVRPEAGAAIRHESILAHQLVPGEVTGAPGVPEVVAEIDRRLAEGALLVHFSSVDVPFLKRLYRVAGRRWPRPPVVDTAGLLLRLAARDRIHDPDGTAQPVLRLGEARQRLGLPAYDSHDALSDALATAEMFLVVARKLGARTLRDLR
jgi:DNA polymerase-3 subunit epsilon